MRTNIKPMRAQAGLSLIELMVAGLIGLILTLGLFQIFVSNRQAFDTTSASANVQETGRIATEILARSIRNADHWGCVDLTNVFNNLKDSGSASVDENLGFGRGVDGTDNNQDPDNNTLDADGNIVDADGNIVEVADNIRNGTDTLILRGTRGSQGITIDEPMPASSANLKVTAVDGLAVGDIIVLSNCRGGDVFQITQLPGDQKIQHQSGNTLSPGNGKHKGNCVGGGGVNCLSQLYDVGASVMVPYMETFYIRTGAGGEPALFMKTVNMGGANPGKAQSIELIAGVEDMQILYGEDTDTNGSADVYRDAGAVADMGNVVSIRIELLVRSSQRNVLDSAQTLTFNGEAVDGSDRRLRRIYTMTSTLRNRI